MRTDPKHIAIIAHHYPPHITGVGFIAQNHARRLAALGHKVTVITSETSRQEKSYSADGVRVIRIKAWNISETWGAPFPIFSPALLPVLIGHMRQADIVHVHDAFYISSFLAAVIARIYRKPIVLTQHVAMIAHPSRIIVAIQKAVYATSGALIFRLSDSIIVYNDRVKDFLSERGFAKKIVSLPNGVDTELFHPTTPAQRLELKKRLGLDPNKKTLLFIGRFVPKKGFDKVLAVRSSEYEIVCAGGEAPKKEVLLGVTFLGKLDQKMLAQVYQLGDIFILPSESEGFPLCIQEAMASGLPIITTKDPGYEQYGLDEKLVYFIEHPTEALLRQAIQAILHDAERLRTMSAYGEAHARAHFSWPVIISKLEKIYDAVAAAAPAADHSRDGKKKIALVSDAVYPFNKGGKEKRIYDATRRLAAHGHDVTIYCMKWWQGEKTIMQEGVTLHGISPCYPLYAGKRRSLKEALLFALHCLKLLGKDFDVVEVDHIPHPVLFTMKLVCLIKRKRMIVTWHEVWGKRYWKEYAGSLGAFAYWIEKASVFLPDVIISVSEHTTRSLREVLGREKGVVTIPNGLDIAEISKNAAGRSGADIIFAGRLLSHKNIDVLLRALSILVKKDPAIKLLIIGEGPERPMLELLAEELGLENNVSFQDFLEDHDDLYRVMRGSRVFVLPSTREGFGIVVLEANACGLPVVTIDHPENAAKELIVQGKNGIVIELDEARMAEAIEQALRMKKAGSDYIPYIEKYDWAPIVSKILSVYN